MTCSFNGLPILAEIRHAERGRTEIGFFAGIGQDEDDDRHQVGVHVNRILGEDRPFGQRFDVLDAKADDLKCAEQQGAGDGLERIPADENDQCDDDPAAAGDDVLEVSADIDH